MDNELIKLSIFANMLSGLFLEDKIVRAIIGSPSQYGKTSDRLYKVFFRKYMYRTSQRTWSRADLSEVPLCQAIGAKSALQN